jgi:hypothetical protein
MNLGRRINKNIFGKEVILVSVRYVTKFSRRGKIFFQTRSFPINGLVDQSSIDVNHVDQPPSPPHAVLPALPQIADEI